MWRRPGVRSFEAHRAAEGREDVGAARREALTARTLAELEGGLDALARGEMTPSHAQRLGTTMETVDPVVRTELLNGEGAAMVRKLAKEHEPRVFGRKIEELAAARHPATVQDTQEAIRARRYLRLAPGPHGTRIDGLLDPVAGYRLQLAIEAASPRPGAEDTRTLGQRNADALEAIAGVVLSEASSTSQSATQVTITMTETSFLAAQHHLTGATHTRRPSSTASESRAAGSEVDDAPPFPAIRAADGPLLPPADLGKLLCGSRVGRLVVTAEGVPLNAGRSQRLYTGARRRTVEQRDQHCAWPDCHTAARYCEVHHLDHWDSDHGETDTHRGVLVCVFHHHELHRYDLDLVAGPPVATSRSPVLPGDPDVVTGPPVATSRSPVLPGDPDYEPPRYQTVPRAHTAAERRARLSERLRRKVEQRSA
ncbi:MAG: 13E12 repeat family protein [Actinomycetota bacterium]|nr:13E12 repeat family protein [Actinomycetota bacterium]